MKNAIVSLFNIVLKSGTVPTDWCTGIIIPLFKNKGSVDDVNNYRGITLLSVLGKLFTSALNSRLTTYLEGISALGEDQAGFREGYSTLNHIFVLHCLIDFYLQKNKRLYCAFVDYSKAFDLIDRSTLWIKLLGIGIKGKVINVIYNLYASAKSCVKKKNDLSQYFSCNVGVRQGDNLSPLLFATFLNDFESYVSQEYEGLSFVNRESTRVICDVLETGVYIFQIAPAMGGGRSIIFSKRTVTHGEDLLFWGKNASSGRKSILGKNTWSLREKIYFWKIISHSGGNL